MQHFIKSCLAIVIIGIRPQQALNRYVGSCPSPKHKIIKILKNYDTLVHITINGQQFFLQWFFVSPSMMAKSQWIAYSMMRMHNQCQQSNFLPKKVLLLLKFKGIYKYLMVWLWLKALTCPFRSQKHHHLTQLLLKPWWSRTNNKRLACLLMTRSNTNMVIVIKNTWVGTITDW